MKLLFTLIKLKRKEKKILLFEENKLIIKYIGDNKMNTEKYIEIAIFVIITTLLSTTLSYFVAKKIEKSKKKR